MGYFHKFTAYFNLIIMNKSFFLLLLVSSFLFFSCKKEEVGLPRIANGKINNIAIIVDDLLWNSEVGDSVRNKFAAPVLDYRKRNLFYQSVSNKANGRFHDR
jgi:hypothetical protein